MSSVGRLQGGLQLDFLLLFYDVVCLHGKETMLTSILPLSVNVMFMGDLLILQSNY